jgi:hypothetical protein
MRHDGIEKTLRVVITSGLVNRRNFLDALEQRLAPPLEQVCGARCVHVPACVCRPALCGLVLLCRPTPCQAAQAQHIFALPTPVPSR